jgi:hypothetical protein
MPGCSDIWELVSHESETTPRAINFLFLNNGLMADRMFGVCWAPLRPLLRWGIILGIMHGVVDLFGLSRPSRFWVDRVAATLLAGRQDDYEQFTGRHVHDTSLLNSLGSRKYCAVYWTISVESTGGVICDPFYLFDIHSGSFVIPQVLKMFLRFEDLVTE